MRSSSEVTISAVPGLKPGMASAASKIDGMMVATPYPAQA
ncbi:Uncharacterised protein [Mycobacteroides abscessus subsp. abscessus]|nr:Uncharacterised protein [Mycobacteroides abscessus subsp. abscessus]